jgi:hypothetical protein
MKEGFVIKKNLLNMKVHTIKGPKYWNTYQDECDVIVLEMNEKFYGDWFDPDYEKGILEELLFSEKKLENLFGWVGNSMEDLIEKIDKDFKATEL